MTALINKGTVLKFENGVEVKLPAAIPDEKYITHFNNLVLVTNNNVDERNIWCFDELGKKIWEIEPSVEDSPYFLIEKSDGELLAYTQKGECYLISMSDGSISWIGGEQGGDAEVKNAILLKRRKTRGGI